MDRMIYDALDNPRIANRRHLLKEYLQHMAAYQLKHPNENETIAYRITGLMSTDFALKLRKDDPYMQVLWLASRLELPKKCTAMLRGNN